MRRIKQLMSVYLDDTYTYNYIFWRELRLYNVARIKANKGPRPPEPSTPSRRPGNNPAQAVTLHLSAACVDGLQRYADAYEYKNIAQFIEAVGWGFFELSPEPLPTLERDVLQP